MEDKTLIEANLLKRKIELCKKIRSHIKECIGISPMELEIIIPDISSMIRDKENYYNEEFKNL